VCELPVRHTVECLVGGREPWIMPAPTTSAASCSSV